MALAPLTDDQVARLEDAADLKRHLIGFALTPPFARPLRQLRRKADRPGRAALDRDVDAIESLLFEHTYDDGTTVLDRYVRDRRHIPDHHRALASRWKDGLYGVFEVIERRDEQLELLNLIDELTYVTAASMGPESLGEIEPGWFYIARLLPLGELWFLSGTQMGYTPDRRAAMATIVNELAITRPDLILRNPEKQRRADEIAHDMHESFLACFGSDEVIVPGPEVAATYQRFIDTHSARVREDRPPNELPTPSVLDDPSFAEPFVDADQVALIHHPQSGVWFFVNYPLVVEAFRDPGSLERADVRETVAGYLDDDDSIPPWLFDRLCAAHPEHADAVFRAVLRRPAFTWAADGESLMREHKAAQLRRTHMAPGIIPLPAFALEHYANQQQK